MNTATGILSNSALEQLEVQLLGEDELHSISGGGPFAAALVVVGAGLGFALAGVLVGALFYCIINAGS